MKAIRAIAVFPFEVLLGLCVTVLVLVGQLCRFLGWVCRRVEGKQ